MSKRIVFNTSTPNDQGGIIPNEALNFVRYNKNPVLLKNHVWGSDPIGQMTDIKVIDGQYTGVPVFHRLTKESIETADMYDAGHLKACSIGGFAEWKTNSAGQAQLDKDGNRVCALFDMYEISICTLPSNQDAVTLSADAKELAVKIYEKEEGQQVIAKLSTQLKENTVETKPTTLTAEQELEAAEKKVADLKAAKLAAEKKTAEEKAAADLLKAGGASDIPGELPGVMKDVLSFAKAIFGLKSKETEIAPPAVAPGVPKVTTPNPTEATVPLVTLKAKKSDAAKEKMEKAKEAASKAVEAAKAAKAKADAEDATDEMKAGHKSAMEAAEKAIEAAEKAEAEYKAALEDDDDEEGEGDDKKSKNAAAAEKTTNATTKMEKKTPEELRAELKLVAPPTTAAKVGLHSQGLTFTKLHAEAVKNPQSNEGRIYNRVMDGSGDRQIGDYAIMLNSIMNDPKFAAIVEKARFNQNVSPQEMPAMAANIKARGGLTLQQLAGRLNSGMVNVLGRDNVLREATTLNSTDNMLASPDLFAVEWLPLAIFSLFPSGDWKNDIPVFSAQMTGENTGLIWTNVNADPAITKGAQPTNPANYTYSDVAVALSLAAYWLQPMLWTPLTMHQFRYDQMSTGWAQAFAKWGAVIDDNLLYTLASTVPAGSIVSTSGTQFNINGTGANKFYWNPAFTGNLLGPAYNDIFAIEQVYNNQNFEIEKMNPVLTVDPIMTRMIKQDPDTKSLLTRFIESNKSELLTIGNTKLVSRSRLAIYDPATGQVKDPNGSIPSTAVSASVGFIPSQVGIGLGMLDVFMQQSPGNYGYLMSADIRAGIVPLRANFNGTTLFTYGAGNV